STKGFFFLGVVIGFLGLFVGATGLLLGPFILRPDLNKESTVATQAAMQTFNHALKIGSFIFLGFHFLNYSLTIAGLCLGAILGSMVGVKILKQISSEFFFKLFKIVMFLSALKIFWDFFKGRIL
nr:TSUP family transporter [Bacteriovoracaceae bacterium]